MTPRAPGPGTARGRRLPSLVRQWVDGCASGWRRALVLLGTALVLAGTAPAAAQNAPDSVLAVSAAPGSGALRIRLGNVLGDASLLRALHSGLPVRIQVIAELWKDGFIDSEKGKAEWKATVLFDPLARSYLVLPEAPQSEGVRPQETRADSVLGVVKALQSALSLELRPREAGRYYYLVRVEVGTLSLSDLEELQRWLQGDLGSAVKGRESVETAVGRGIQRMLVWMLGLPARTFRAQTGTFEVSAADVGGR